MDAVLHLMFILVGAIIILGALSYFAQIRGGIFSIPGWLTIGLVVIGGYVILIGVGLIAMPGGVT